jgi:hypothetical protein
LNAKLELRRNETNEARSVHSPTGRQTIEEHKTTMKIEVRKTMNYEDYESTLYSWIFVGTVGL